MKERRKYRRKLVSTRVMFYHPEIPAFESATQDISNGGMRISVKEDYTNKIRVKDNTKIVLLNSGDVAIVFNMTVIRVSKDEIAMEILNCERNGKIFSVADLRKSLK